MASLIASRRLFRPLTDAALFAAADLINGGRAVAWGDEVDMCADPLWLDAHPRDNPRSAQPHAAE